MEKKTCRILCCLSCCLFILLTGCTKKYVNDYNLGVDFYQLNNYSKSIQHFQDAVIKAPNWASGYYGLGLAYFKSGIPE